MISVALWPLLICLWFCQAISPEQFGSKPNIIVLLCDNVGWANVGFHRPEEEPVKEIYTPHIDKLALTGVQLDRHYTYKFCSPSRSSFLSGRLPFHVNIYNDPPTWPGQGVPTNMTMMAAKLKDAGYKTHMAGKWHVGMATPAQTPLGKGFDSSLNYFHSENNYYNSHRQEGCEGLSAVDLWDTDHPARGLNGTQYEERLFADRMTTTILTHDTSSPLFLYYAFHTSCVGQNADGTTSLQPPSDYLERFSFINDPDRRANHAMVALMDDVVGNITAALKQQGMWENTLLLWSSDNGGAVHLGGGANSYPLRGGYFNNWEGGIRVAALLNGGFLPRNVRGTKLEGFIHIADWYSTFCYLAGVDPQDQRAAASVPPLPPIDSLNVWPLITGETSVSPRQEWPLTPLGEDVRRGGAVYGGDAAYIAEGRWKLIVGSIRQAGWCGPIHPNQTTPWDSYQQVLNCTVPQQGKIGCLFDILNDPFEHVDLALENPTKAREILLKMQQAEKHWYNPERGSEDPAACKLARSTGFWQPWWGR